MNIRNVYDILKAFCKAGQGKEVFSVSIFNLQCVMTIFFPCHTENLPFCCIVSQDQSHHITFLLSTSHSCFLHLFYPFGWSMTDFIVFGRTCLDDECLCKSLLAMYDSPHAYSLVSLHLLVQLYMFLYNCEIFLCISIKVQRSKSMFGGRCV